MSRKIFDGFKNRFMSIIYIVPHNYFISCRKINLQFQLKSKVTIVRQAVGVKNKADL
jgi:hypothetical protein